MKKLIILLALLSPAIARANTVTPQFTTGNMTSNTVTTQTIKEVTKKEVMGAAVKTWSGTNVTASGNIIANGNINLGNAAGDQVKVTGVFEADQLQIDGTVLTSTVTNGPVSIQGNGTGNVNIRGLDFQRILCLLLLYCTLYLQVASFLHRIEPCFNYSKGRIVKTPSIKW